MERRPLAKAPQSRSVPKSTHWTEDEWGDVAAAAQAKGWEAAVFIRKATLHMARTVLQAGTFGEDSRQILGGAR